MRFYIILGLAAMAMTAATGERVRSDIAPPESLNTTTAVNATTAVNGTTTDDGTPFDDETPFDDDDDDTSDEDTPDEDTPEDDTNSDEDYSAMLSCYWVGTPPNCRGTCRAGYRVVGVTRCGGPGGCCLTGLKKLCCRR